MLAFIRSLVRPATFPELVDEYFASQTFRSISHASQRPYRRVINRLANEVGNRSVRSLTRRDVEAVLARRSPGAANDALKKLRILARFAIERGYRRDDPTMGIRRFAAGAGHHTWTEAEITRFQDRWPIGTRERLAFALLLFTGQRRSDVVRMEWEHLVGGDEAAVLHVNQRKTGVQLVIPVHRDLGVALSPEAASGGAILRTSFGKPFTAAGFGNWMAERIQDAGLPDRCVTHGLRKASARRLAEAGCSSKEIAAITGHQTLREVERYTKAAEQARLADHAMSRMTGKTCS